MEPIRNILIVAQDGRLQYEALLFAASLRHVPENRALRLVVAEPQPGPLWPDDPRISRPAIRRELRALGADIVPLHSKVFGARYPQGNKLEALALLPAAEPFVFFDTDTLITGPIADVVAGPPTASTLVEPTWPREPLYGPSLAQIWGALYHRVGLEMGPTLDTRFGPDDWRRYLYFNAGWFTAPCPHALGARLMDYARQIERDPPPELALQALYPWLDQIVLPLAIAGLGGGRRATGLDGAKSLHYRALPEIYAFGPDHAVAVLEQVTRAPHLWDIFNQHVAFRRMIFKENGPALRQIMAGTPPSFTYWARKKQIMDAGHWVR
jgi:hypothetical protein